MTRISHDMGCCIDFRTNQAMNALSLAVSGGHVGIVHRLLSLIQGSIGDENKCPLVDVDKCVFDKEHFERNGRKSIVCYS